MYRYTVSKQSDIGPPYQLDAIHTTGTSPQTAHAAATV
jgi:hypothetical protein